MRVETVPVMDESPPSSGAAAAARRRLSWLWPVGVAVGAVSVAGVTVATLAGRGGSRDAAPVVPPPPSVSAPAPGSVPEVAGLPLDRVRAVLAQAGLSLGSVQPTIGTPGAVVGTVPPAGSPVQPGTAITLLIGAPPERLGQEALRDPFQPSG